MVEALAAGTLVCGTPLAVEFLGADLRAFTPVGATPAALAAAIVDLLELPAGRRRERIEAAQQCLLAANTWDHAARTLLDAVRG